jgi:AcrR family transcriptional regulator
LELVARTPSKEAHDKVLNAAMRLISERGVEATSMDAIAAESGVSKATLYKHWASKDALLIEMIGLAEKLPEFDSGDTKADLRAFLRHLAQSRKREELMRMWPRVVSYAASNPEFARVMRTVSFGPRWQQITRILKKGAASGELRAEIDTDFAMDLLIGPIIHRKFVDPDHQSAPAELADRVVDYFWEIFRKEKPVSFSIETRER